jgi:hypothetical protein
MIGVHYQRSGVVEQAVSGLQGQSLHTVAQAASGTVTAIEKRSRGQRHRQGVVEQAGGNSSGRRGIGLRAQRSGAPMTVTVALR